MTEMSRRRLSRRRIGTLARRGELVRVGRRVYVRTAVAAAWPACPTAEHLLRAARGQRGPLGLELR
jgi:hypothetical protein